MLSFPGCFKCNPDIFFFCPAGTMRASARRPLAASQNLKKKSSQHFFVTTPTTLSLEATKQEDNELPEYGVGWVVYERKHWNPLTAGVKKLCGRKCRLSNRFGLWLVLHLYCVTVTSTLSWDPMRVEGGDDAVLSRSNLRPLPQIAVSRLVGHEDGPIPLVRFTGMFIGDLPSFVAPITTARRIISL
jgi:hypothetical protein